MLPKVVLSDTSVANATDRSVAKATEGGPYNILYPRVGGRRAAAPAAHPSEGGLEGPAAGDLLLARALCGF